MTASDGARRHLIGDVVGLADRKRNDRQRRVGRSAGAELAPVRDEQVRDLVGLPPFVADSVFGPLTHPATTHVMARGEGRCLVDLLGAERFVDGTALAECVIIRALTSSHQRRCRARACNASTTSVIMLRSALFMTERILQASPPTTRWGKMIAYSETKESGNPVHSDVPDRFEVLRSSAS